ncbi:MAG: hypothetical protein EAZ08_10670 [Cytophagales bacterium]|nr:MAG: hypothetical protein EAZ08_10670 [Cytophagales bacterium]
MYYKTFYAPKLALFMAFYLLTLTCVMQGDRFFKSVRWLHDFSRSVNFQSVEDVFDESTHRFTNKISFPKRANDAPNERSIFLSNIFITPLAFLNRNEFASFLSFYHPKTVSCFLSPCLYLEHHALIC